jgi:AcrR family transcriptional regulator
MGTKERREREKQDIRQKILDAAQQIITEDGFAALSMRKIANRIEYSAASIYLHFRSREEIAQEISEVGFGKLLAKMTAALGAKDASVRLRAVALAYLTFGLENPETYRLIFMGDSEYTAAAFKKNDPEGVASKSYQLLLDLANDLRREDSFAGKGSAREIVEMIWTSMHGIVSLHLTCVGFQLSPKALAKTMVDTLLRGLLVHA